MAATVSVLRATLENGLKVVIVPNHLAPVATTILSYHVGSNEAPEGFPGRAHALEHMMFRGSPGLSAQQLSAISAGLGGRFNASTQQTATNFFFTVPADDLPVALHIQAIRMQDVLISSKTWEKERGAIEQEVSRDLSNPQYLFYKKLLARLFAGTPYAHDALGTRSSFNKTTSKSLRHFYDQWYAPNNATLVIAGDVNARKTLKKIQGLFGDISSSKLPKRPEVNLQPVKPSRISLKTDKPYGLVFAAFRMPGYNSPDYPAALVLERVLSNHRGRLYSKLVPTGKALSTGFNLQAMADTGLGYAYGVFSRGGNGQKLLKAVRKQLKQWTDSGIPPGLVKAAKRHVATSAASRKDSIPGLAWAWSQALNIQGFRSPDQLVHAVQQVQVNDVESVAREYLNQKHMVTAILTPRGGGKTQNGSTTGPGKESFTPENAKPVQLPDWASRRLKEVKVPPYLLEPHVTTLDNGLTVIVQPESASKTVRIYGHIRNKPGLSQPKGKAGVNSVLDSLFEYGSKSKGRVAFQKALDMIGASESAGTDFSLSVLASHFEKGVSLLAANELHPALPKKAFQVVRRQIASQVAAKLQSPGYLAQHSMLKALYPKEDPATRHATKKSVMGVTLDDVRDYYQQVFRPDETTIVVIGNVTPEKADQIIKKHFGDWEAHGEKPRTTLPPVPPNKPDTIHVPDPSRTQVKVSLAETMELTRSNPDYYALKLGNNILSRGFYASRLYRALREQRGLVYYVGSSVSANKTRSKFSVSYGADADNVDQARTVIVHNLKKMQKKPISADELHRARADLVRSIPLGQASLSRIGHQLLHLATHDLPLNEPSRAAKIYLDLAPKDIRKAWDKWLRPGDLVQVTQGPEPE